MSWQLLTLISVLALSTSVVLQRVLLSKDKLDPFAYAVSFQAIVGLLLLPVALVNGLALPGIERIWLPAIIAIVCFGVGHIAYAKTLQKVEASAFSVLFATQAIWIMALGFVVFHENLTVLQLMGTCLIFGAVALAANIHSLRIDRGTALGLLTGLLFGIAITAWSYVGRHTDGPTWAAVSFIGTALASLAIRPRTIYAVQSVLHSSHLPKLLLLGVFYGIGSLAMLYAYREGTFTVVTPLRQTSIIVTVFLALLLLRTERRHWLRKVAAAGVCFGGVWLIVSA